MGGTKRERQWKSILKAHGENRVKLGYSNSYSIYVRNSHRLLTCLTYSMLRWWGRYDEEDTEMFSGKSCHWSRRPLPEAHSWWGDSALGTVSLCFLMLHCPGGSGRAPHGSGLLQHGTGHSKCRRLKSLRPRSRRLCLWSEADLCFKGDSPSKLSNVTGWQAPFVRRQMPFCLTAFQRRPS